MLDRRFIRSGYETPEEALLHLEEELALLDAALINYVLNELLCAGGITPGFLEMAGFSVREINILRSMCLDSRDEEPEVRVFVNGFCLSPEQAAILVEGTNPEDIYSIGDRVRPSRRVIIPLEDLHLGHDIPVKTINPRSGKP